MENKNEFMEVSIGIGIISLIIGLLIWFCMWGLPHYNVYRSSLQGQAILAHAKYSREVAVLEAKAKMESAELLGQAEVLRAKGVAQANQIIGNSLRNNEAYLRYLWINNMETNDKQVIYVPTEAGLPILEAGHR